MWTADAEVAKPESQPHVPDGTHVAEVKYVDFRKKDRFKCPANKDGEYLLMLLEASGFATFWVDVPCHYRGTIEAVCRSASVDVPNPSEDWACGVLKGRMVTVETVHGISKSGNDYVRVERWKAGPAPLPKEVREAPPRPRAASKPVSADPDDIPF